MITYPVDLHSHTTASDGQYSPTQQVELAKKHGLTALGITDHDTIDGLAEAQAAGQRLGVEIVNGVEFSLKHEDDKSFIGIHLLGYFFDPNHPALVEMINRIYEGRVEQKARQIEKMRSFGFDISVEEIFAKVNGVPGRPHIVTALMERHPDRFTDSQQIYDEYLGVDAKAHVKRKFAVTMGQATKVIKQAGGITVLAHPGMYQHVDPTTVIRNAKAEGVEGVEVFYNYDKSHGPSEGNDWIKRVELLANELDLLQSGGTDFHGNKNGGIELGDMGLTEPQFAKLKKGWRSKSANRRVSESLTR